MAVDRPVERELQGASVERAIVNIVSFCAGDGTRVRGNVRYHLLGRHLELHELEMRVGIVAGQLKAALGADEYLVGRQEGGSLGFCSLCQPVMVSVSQIENGRESLQCTMQL